MAEKNDSKIELGEELGEDFQTALRLAGQIGPTPSSFSSVIRALLSEHQKNASNYSNATRSSLQRLLKGQSIQAPVYYAAHVFKTADLSASKSLSALSLANLFKADELAAVLSVTYLSRRIRSIADAEEWQYIVKHLELHANLGAFVGLASTTLGFSRGLLVGALPSIALGVFHKSEDKGFKEYRRLLKSKNISYDPSFELKKWYCSSVQIASCLMQSVGFGVEIAENFSHVLEEAGHAKESELELKLRAAHYCIQSLATSAKVADDHQKIEALELTSEAISGLEKRAGELRESCTGVRWIETGKDDVSPEKTPQLFPEQARSTPAQPEPASSEMPPAAAELSAPQEYSYETLPPEVQAVISKEDFANLSPQDIAQLITETVQKPAKT